MLFALPLAAERVDGRTQPDAKRVAPPEVSRALDIVSRGLVSYIGVAAQNMKTGEQALLNADDPFPMASTF